MGIEIPSHGEVTQQAKGRVCLRSDKSLSKLFTALRLQPAKRPKDVGDGHGHVGEHHVWYKSEVDVSTKQQTVTVEAVHNTPEERTVHSSDNSTREKQLDLALDHDPDIGTQLPRYETLDTLTLAPDAQPNPTSTLPPPTDTPSHPRISKPVVIPRIGKGATAPLLRAWAPELTSHDLSKHAFIGLIDTLNILSQPPAHAMTLRIAAIGMAFIPLEGADGIAAVTELAAEALAAYMVRTRLAHFLAKTNDELLHPRDLHARLLSSKAMRRAVKIADSEPLVAPLSEDTLVLSSRERCLVQLKGYSCALSEDVPQAEPQTKMLQRIAAWHVRHQNACFEKGAVRARKKAWRKYMEGTDVGRDGGKGRGRGTSREKGLEKEGKMERKRAERLQWLVVQDWGEVKEEVSEGHK